jgi:Phasin protein
LRSFLLLRTAQFVTTLGPAIAINPNCLNQEKSKMAQPSAATATERTAWPFPNPDVIKLYQPAVEKLSNYSSAVCDAYATMGTEWLSFVNRRLHVDLSLPQRLAKCKSPQDCLQEWSKFMMAATEDYKTEFIRLSEMSSNGTQQAVAAFRFTVNGSTK